MTLPELPDVPRPAPVQAALAWLVRGLIAIVFVIVAVDLIGWATGRQALTRIYPTWPQMTPWTAVLLAVSAAALLVQSGRAAATTTRVGRVAAATVAGLSLVFLAEYAAGRPFGLDEALFPESVRQLQSSWPGRPSPQAASSFLMLSAAVMVQRIDRRWARTTWAVGLSLAAVIPLVVLLSYMTESLSLVHVAPSTGMGMSTALGLLTLAAAAVAARPDRHPVSWLLARPDRRMLLQMVAVLAAMPPLTMGAHLTFQSLGVSHDSAWLLALAGSTITVGAAAVFIVAHASRLLAASEQRYRLLTDNVGDVITHIRNGRFAWLSPSVGDTMGAPPEYWLGREVAEMVPADDHPVMIANLKKVADGGTLLERVRVRSADGRVHWAHLHAKPYFDSEGRRDGHTATFRLIDDEVAIEQEVEEARRRQALAEQRYRRSVDNAAIGMCLTSRTAASTRSTMPCAGFSATAPRPSWQ